MKRIRYGLTGLAVVFLFVLLGTVILRSSGEAPGNEMAANLEEPNEPLAELGVAPGQSDGSNTANVAANLGQ